MRNVKIYDVDDKVHRRLSNCDEYFVIESKINNYIRFVVGEGEIAVVEGRDACHMSIDVLEELHDIYEDIQDYVRMGVSLCKDR